MSGIKSTTTRKVSSNSKSRERILDAFRSMVLSQPYYDITIQSVIREANVARSTFYQNFPNKRSLLLASLSPLLSVLADCARGRAVVAEVQAFSEHCWENREFGRIILSSKDATYVCDHLAKEIGNACDAIDRVAIAHSYIGILRSWFSGSLRISPGEFATWLPAAR